MANNGVNKAIIVGNLGKEPDLRFMPNGKAVCNFTMATSESWKDKNTGAKKEETQWHRISAFGKVAEIISQYAHKGSKVYVEGKIKTRKWQNKDGVDQYTTEIIVEQFQLMDKKGSTSREEGASPSQGYQEPAGNPGMDFDDDLPF